MPIQIFVAPETSCACGTLFASKQGYPCIAPLEDRITPVPTRQNPRSTSARGSAGIGQSASALRSR